MCTNITSRLPIILLRMQMPYLTDSKQSRCINPADLLYIYIKNSRLWQNEQIRKRHDELMSQRKQEDNEKEVDFCKRERNQAIIFPAIEISNEIEKNQDTTCIDTNRDELLKSFCSFTSDLDNLFQIQNIDKEEKHFGQIYVERNDDDLIQKH